MDEIEESCLVSYVTQLDYILTKNHRHICEKKGLHFHKLKAFVWWIHWEHPLTVQVIGSQTLTVEYTDEWPREPCRRQLSCLLHNVFFKTQFMTCDSSRAVVQTSCLSYLSLRILKYLSNYWIDGCANLKRYSWSPDDVANVFVILWHFSVAPLAWNVVHTFMFPSGYI